MNALWLVATVALACSLTGYVRRHSIARNLLDHPNERSSHSIPTPRGGGLSIVLATTLLVLVEWASGGVDARLATSLVFGGAAIAALGLKDDCSSLPVSIRLVVQSAVAVWTTWMLSQTAGIRIGGMVLERSIYSELATVVAIVWAINLFNFMDGIDGIAASEAMFVCGAGGAMIWISGALSGVGTAALLVAAASGGFLVWNWPPARIFMGDVGSSYLGYVIATCALAAGRGSDVAVYQWLILGGVFFVDATVTLLLRLLRGKRIHVAHRTHTYQILARRWEAHRRVTLVVWLINICWLLPSASAIYFFPAEAWLIAIVALAPLAVAAVTLGAGREDVTEALKQIS